MWESNGDSSKLLKICIFPKSNKPMFFRCKPCTVQMQNKRSGGMMVSWLFHLGLHLCLIQVGHDPFEVRTASADILKHVQVPGEIDGLTAERPGYLSPTNGSSTRHLQDKAEGTRCLGARGHGGTYSVHLP